MKAAFFENGEPGPILKIILPPPIVKKYAGKFVGGQVVQSPFSFVNINGNSTILA